MDFSEVLNTGTVLLDSGPQHGGGGSYLFKNPLRTLRADSITEVEGLLAGLDEAVRRGFFVAGFLCYEAGYAFLPEKFKDTFAIDWRAEVGYPLAWFGVYEERQEIESPSFKSQCGLPSLQASDSREAYVRAVRAIKDLIREGDLYQVNHTTRFEAPFDGDPLELYSTLASRQPVQYGCIVALDDLTILSFSPELFFDVEGAELTARPMKGTAPRGATPEEDRSLSDWLQRDEKNRAENLMIVDLLRNDLSRVCRSGSVVSPDLYSIETLPTLHQMTSTVRGELKDETRISDIFRSLFPCGSITGAPKIRAMRRINELESSPRGVYCGAIGFAGPSSAFAGPPSAGPSRASAQEGSSPNSEKDSFRATFSVAIRSIAISDSKMTCGTGGGIVWDSDPEDEYAEAMLKLQFLSGTDPATSGFQLIETMRFEGEISLIEFHLDRVEHSCETFGFSFDREVSRRTILDFCAELEPVLEPEIAHRIRALFSIDGSIEIGSLPLSEQAAEPLNIGLSPFGMSSGNPWFRHKTTRRDTYDQVLRHAQSRGWFDALLTNERGELTEGAKTNVFVKIDGAWLTPPVASGLLAGVGRRAFMLKSGAREEIVRPLDLDRAKKIVVTNAVIGAREALYQKS